jgi:16S rRNA (cytosine1402-N4)-methyltransferase
MSSTVHTPVLPKEILELGVPQSGQVWVDGTGGGGGHARLLLEALSPDGKLLVIDRDPSAASQLQQIFESTAVVRHGSYDNAPEFLNELGWPQANGILLDLGLSSDQLADRDRGFSFQTEGVLDMRFDTTSGLPAWQWIARVDEQTLADTIFKFGEERFSRRIAKRIVERRKTDPIRSADQLRELIYQCVPAGRPSKFGRKHGRIDPATRTFQALRIAVNEELAILERALQVLPNCLAEQGQLMIISFHSLEDRLVKHAFRADARLEVITRKPIEASDFEISNNPRSRSAKLRVARKKCVENPT